MSSNFFATQTSSRNQGPKILNSKSSAPQGWGTSSSLGGIPTAFPSAPNRTGTLQNFAQAIGGGMPSHNSLDMSEFPSLSGGPQSSQISSNMPQVWNNNTLRQTQPTPTNGSQRGGLQNDTSRQASQNAFGFNSNLADQMDNRVPPVSRVDNAGDDFPPLGGALNAMSRPDRSQDSGAFGRGIFGLQSNTQQIQGDGGIEDIRSPIRTTNRPVGAASQSSQPFSNDDFTASRSVNMNGLSQQIQPPQHLHFDSNHATTSSQTDSLIPSMQQTQQSDTRPIFSSLGESDKYGLQGLLAMLPGRASTIPNADDNPINIQDQRSSLVMGQDVSNLGIDFDDPDPILPKLSTPFSADNPTTFRPAIPEHIFPAAYSVHNVPPLQSRIGNFSDDTLFAIFYQQPRDVMQEVSAAELYTRDWRWHKELRQWMMKDASMAQPMRITERSERGVYVFFDALNWRRERREFVLNYDHLDQRHGPTTSNPPGS